jgi:REP element-mobilizing transposase RayT
MSRRPRIHFHNAVYHAYSRGVDGQDIFRDAEDRYRFLGLMNRVSRDLSVHVMAYCLMGNHFHLAIQVAHVDLSAAMHKMLTPYALHFNGKYRRVGHLFQGRFRDNLCVDEGYLNNLIRYIHLNPVRAGFVSEAHLWPWSSLKGKQLEAGGDLTGFDAWASPERQRISLAREVRGEPTSLDELGSVLCRAESIPEEELKNACYDRRIVKLRRRFTRAAVTEGHRITQIAAWLGIDKGRVSRYAQN